MSEAREVHRRQLSYATIMAAAIIVAGVTFAYGSWPHWYQLVGFSVAACLLGTRTIRLSRTLGTVSVGFIFVFATIVELGPAAAIIAGAASALGATVLCSVICRRKRAPSALVVVTNVAIISLAAGTAGWCYQQLEVVYETIGLRVPLLPAFIVIGVYYLINSMGMALMASADGKRNAISVWSENLYWTVLPYYVGGAVVVVVQMAAAHVGEHLWLVLIPPVALIHIGMDVRAKAKLAQRVDERSVERGAE